MNVRSRVLPDVLEGFPGCIVQGPETDDGGVIWPPLRRLDVDEQIVRELGWVSATSGEAYWFLRRLAVSAVGPPPWLVGIDETMVPLVTGPVFSQERSQRVGFGFTERGSRLLSTTAVSTRYGVLTSRYELETLYGDLVGEASWLGISFLGGAVPGRWRDWLTNARQLGDLVAVAGVVSVYVDAFPPSRTPSQVLVLADDDVLLGKRLELINQGLARWEHYSNTARSSPGASKRDFLDWMRELSGPNSH